MATNNVSNIATPEAARAEAEFLVNVGKQLRTAEETPRVEEIDGHKYLFFRGQKERITPIDPPKPDVIEVFSLTGLVDFIKSDVDGLFQNPERRHVLMVCNVSSVELITPLTGYENRRQRIAACDALVPKIPFDCYMDAEDFSIMVQTRFQPSENRDLVLKLAGCLREEQSMNTADDGFSQKVQINKGVATAGEVIVRNPVTLTPLRTFYEVQQPESPFVLRFKEGANVALFEADGGAWKLRAVENIKNWLCDQLKGCNVEVIA